MNQLIAPFKDDPELQNTLNVHDILESAENVDIDYLGNHSLQSISQDVFDSLKEEGMEGEDLTLLCSKLVNYRYIDRLCHIHKGKHVRWLRNGKLTNGGIVVDVKFLDNGTHLLCRNGMKFIQYKFDECPTYQKLTDDELMILQLKECV